MIPVVENVTGCELSLRVREHVARRAGVKRVTVTGSPLVGPFVSRAAAGTILRIGTPARVPDCQDAFAIAKVLSLNVYLFTSRGRPQGGLPLSDRLLSNCRVWCDR